MGLVRVCDGVQNSTETILACHPEQNGVSWVTRSRELRRVLKSPVFRPSEIVDRKNERKLTSERNRGQGKPPFFSFQTVRL